MVGGSSFQPFSIYKCKVVSLSNHFSLRSLSLLLGTAAMWFILKGETSDGNSLWFGGRVSISNSVRQSTSLYLSQWVQSCLLDAWNTWSPCLQFPPSHHPTCNCHINSFSGTVLILLNSCLNTLGGSPCPPGKKKSTELGLTCWGTSL